MVKIKMEINKTENRKKQKQEIQDHMASLTMLTKHLKN